MAFETLSQSDIDRLSSAIEPAFDLMTDHGAFFRSDFLRKRDWTAVIFEGDFSDANQVVSRALTHKNIAFIVCGGLAEYMTNWYKISSHNSDLKEVKNKYFEPSYFITDNLENFCIVSDSDYYWGLAASRRTLEHDCRLAIEEALAEFSVDIKPLVDSGDPHNRKIGHMLLNYLNTCLMSADVTKI